MALSSLTFTSRGVGPYPLNGLDYLSTDHLTVLVDGTPVSATFDDARKSVTLAVAAGASATVVIQRATPRREEERLTQFLDLPTGQAGLSADLLDQDYRQTMLVMGEGRDAADAVPDQSGMRLNDGLQWDAEALRVENLSLGVAGSDMLRKDQLDTADAAARNLPAVTGADNDDGLFVTSGEWAKRTPSQSRTHLGLGTVATLNVGTGANNVPQFSTDSPPRYPTADGRNIDLTSHSIQTDIAKRSLATVVRFGLAGIASPGVDPGVADWSQNSATRTNLSGGWAGRVELNNSGDVDGSSISPYRIRLSAGTWRVRWYFSMRMPVLNSATNRTSLRITNNDDTSSQVIYYDLGLHRPSVDFADVDLSMLPDSILLSLPSADGIVFRWTNRFSGGNNTASIFVLLQRVSATAF